MASAEDLKGLFTPVLTPFSANLQVDSENFVILCKWLLSQGSGLAPFGTTSEANSLSVEERMDLLDRLIDEGIPPNRIVPGNGACAIPDAVILGKAASRHGCAATLMLPPFYYKGVSDYGLFRAYSEVIERVGSSDFRICLYHIPQVSNVGLSVHLIERLVARYPETVVGLKDSSGDWSNTKAVIDAVPGFKVFPGAETFLLKGMRAGAAGCISATANINPAKISTLAENWQAEDADEQQAELDAVRSTVVDYAPIPALKAFIALETSNPSFRRVRPPLVDMEETSARSLHEALSGLGVTLPGLQMAMAA
ncbi:MAG: dihydrodipicolinate synthase family protein [Hyphomicrobiales bacterium]